MSPFLRCRTEVLALARCIGHNLLSGLISLYSTVAKNTTTIFKIKFPVLRRVTRCLKLKFTRSSTATPSVTLSARLRTFWIFRTSSRFRKTPTKVFWSTASRTFWTSILPYAIFPTVWNYRFWDTVSKANPSTPSESAKTATRRTPYLLK